MSLFNAPEAEELVGLVRKRLELPTFGQLSEQWLQVLAGIQSEGGASGSDLATAVLYDRLCRTSPHAGGIQRIASQLGRSPAQRRVAAPPQLPTVAIVPGAFHREFPQLRGDGALLERLARRRGWPCVQIPVESRRPLAENAERINRWLWERETRGPVILATFDRGSAEAKLALQTGSEETFNEVVTWLNLSGILDGSPAVAWYLDRWNRRAFARLTLRLSCYPPALLRELAAGSERLLSGELRLPAGLPAYHLVGFPLQRHLSHPLLRRWHERIAALGPSDGVISLLPACRWPGQLIPIWGADHLLNTRVLPRLLNLLLDQALAAIADA